MHPPTTPPPDAESGIRVSSRPVRPSGKVREGSGVAKAKRPPSLIAENPRKRRKSQQTPPRHTTSALPNDALQAGSSYRSPHVTVDSESARGKVDERTDDDNGGTNGKHGNSEFSREQRSNGEGKQPRRNSGQPDAGIVQINEADALMDSVNAPTSPTVANTSAPTSPAHAHAPATGGECLADRPAEDDSLQHLCGLLEKTIQRRSKVQARKANCLRIQKDIEAKQKEVEAQQEEIRAKQEAIGAQQEQLDQEKNGLTRDQGELQATMEHIKGEIDEVRKLL
ncbi:uncharacterized protein LTR77_010966 [Saxophila tyrrhenica]|uniref:Uncharacterized protein n=1 Tax=Saxophila tyrrhenica TaxID=1690608 RepID=A0AAV9NVJ1_9PEZI|nr:hypothetical protein LTR77_010966 [Saxophila tyrrhenica]